ncbi:disease resistance RPP13-like protein 4 [Morus notabilis]|uniref:disease resistance RPP13-like protein 4 n=1 Tax=Morus notabilis TaxID=981085 RepID=UPI000CED787A|nr:disease resistance RPP13-like protein 4 [Morus notabilis]
MISSNSSSEKSLIKLIDELIEEIQKKSRKSTGVKGGDTVATHAERDGDKAAPGNKSTLKEEGAAPAESIASTNTGGDKVGTDKPGGDTGKNEGGGAEAIGSVPSTSTSGKAFCKWLAFLKKRKTSTTDGQKKEEEPTKSTDAPPPPPCDDQIQRLHTNLVQMKAAMERLNSFEKAFRPKVEDHGKQITVLLGTLEKYLSPPQLGGSSKDIDVGDNVKGIQESLDKINKEMRKLKLRIPSSSSKLGLEAMKKRSDETSGSAALIGGELDKLLSLDASGSFNQTCVFEEIKDIYEGLEDKAKKCLLCFSLFTENEELKKRMLTYWWEGEGFLRADDGDGKKAIEDAAGEILERFEAKGLIEPVFKKRQSTAKAYRMQPVVRSAIIKFADEERVFSCDASGNLAVKLSSETTKQGKATNSSNQPSQSPSSSSNKEQEKSYLEDKLETIFNVNESFPDLGLKWLLKMKALKVLYLGTWRASAKHHIEVDSSDFLKGLKLMSSLRLLSLQGISRISELTDSIKGLRSLRILDLKACHNLEELPKEISFLKNLTHLDISDCYLIDHMPKGLSSLFKLQVLKGFIVDDYLNQTGKFCMLEDLVVMKNLRKLSIIISKKDFPAEKELNALERLEALEKLTVSWGAESTQRKNASDHQPNEARISPQKSETTMEKPNPQRKVTASSTFSHTTTAKDLPQHVSPWKLKKLDLQCYPQQTSPKWMTPQKLASLEKLYIRGGRLGHELLGLSTGVEWESVQTLRLKYLAALKMDWEEMQALFPGLIYLEKVDCPLISMCPCDEDGVWVKHTQ